MPVGNAGKRNHIMPQGNVIHGVDSNDDSNALSCDTAGHLILGAGTAAAGTVAVSNIETIQAVLIASTSIAASAQVISSVLNLTGVKKILVQIDHGRGSTAAFGTNGTEYRLEVSALSSGNDTWNPIVSVLCASTACSSAISAGTAAPSAGASTITITSGTAFVIGDQVMWANTTSAASIEWAKVIAVSGTATFTVLDGITNAQGSTQTIFTQAEHFPLTLNVEAVTRLRCVVNNAASGTTNVIYSRVAIITAL